MDDALRELFGAPLERLAPVAWLVLARCAPLALLAPWLGWRGTAAAVRVAVALALTVSFVPLALASAPELPAGWLSLALLGVREALVGAAFALAVSVPLYALGWAGDLLDRLGGGLFRPGRDAAERGPLGTLHLAAAVVIFVSLGGHRLALAAFGEGLADVPVGAALDPDTGLALALGAGRIVTAALSLAVAFAAPAAVAFVALEASLALAARVAPALGAWAQTLSLRAALSIAVALLSLSALLPRLGPVFVQSVDAARSLLRDL